MSEYQYYEFLAIDRPLTSKEQAAIREISTRAEIGPTSFVNEYHWGDFKGDPHKFLEKWFDAHVYTANWGTRRFMFRAPAELIDLPLARACCGKEGLEVRGEWAIFDLLSECEDGGEWGDEEGSGWMATLAPLRAELMRGDLRVLYLAWLFRLQNEEVADDATEPFVPPGLGKLSAAQQGLVDFLGIDNDLLEFAAKGSSAAEADTGDEEFAAWLVALPAAEKDALLVALCDGSDPLAAPRLRRRFEAARPKRAVASGRRTAGELLEASGKLREERERKEAELAAWKRAAAKAAAEARRTQHLDDLATREPEAWRKVASLIALKKPKEYDEAVSLLKDLRDVAARTHRTADFETRMKDLRADHGGKPSFMERLRKAGL